MYVDSFGIRYENGYKTWVIDEGVMQTLNG